MSVEESNRELGLKLLCGAAVVVASTAGLFIGAADKSVSSADLRTLHRWLLDRGCGPLTHARLRIHVPAAPPRWFAAGQGKRWTEVCFCWLSALWVAWFGVIVATGAYEWFEEMSYMVVGLAMALPYVVVPLLIPGQVAAACAWFVSQTWLTRLAWLVCRASRVCPCYTARGSRYASHLLHRACGCRSRLGADLRCLSDPGQANVWIAVISYVGNYFWTHYFYNLLGASYTFKAWRINNVPIALFFCTHAYFCFYHTMTTVGPVGVRLAVSPLLTHALCPSLHPRSCCYAGSGRHMRTSAPPAG